MDKQEINLNLVKSAFNLEDFKTRKGINFWEKNKLSILNGILQKAEDGEPFVVLTSFLSTKTMHNGYIALDKFKHSSYYKIVMQELISLGFSCESWVSFDGNNNFVLVSGWYEPESLKVTNIISLDVG